LPEPDRDKPLFQQTIPGLPIPGGRVGGLNKEVSYPAPKTQEEINLLKKEAEVLARQKLDGMLLSLARWSWLACGFGILGGLILAGYGLMSGPTARHLVKYGLLLMGVSIVAIPIFYFLAAYTAKIAFFIAIGFGVLILIGAVSLALKHGVSSGGALWQVFTGLQEGKNGDREAWEKIKPALSKNMNERAKRIVKTLKKT
jgi:hypothetical protein